MSDEQRGWRPDDVDSYDQRQPTHGWHQVGESVMVQGVNRIPPYDPATRNHLWAWALLFQMEPGVEKIRLDDRNLLHISPAACYYCEQLYAPNIARGLCTGNA